jgi:alpha-galactosidase
MDALVSSGLADAGYIYFNLDDCWQSSRDKFT